MLEFEFVSAGVVAGGGFVDFDFAAFDGGAVEGCSGVVGVGFVGEGDEAEAFGAAFNGGGRFFILEFWKIGKKDWKMRNFSEIISLSN